MKVTLKTLIPYYGPRFRIVQKINETTFDAAMGGGLDSCRGWLGHAIYNWKNKAPSGGYKFVNGYDPTKGNTFLAVECSNAVQRNWMMNEGLKWLNAKEAKAKVRKSIIHETQHPTIVIVEGSPFWKDSCWKMMLWSFYVKCSMFEAPESHETGYWVHLTKNGNEDILLSKVKIKREIFDPKVYSGRSLSGLVDPHQNAHSNNGFVAICSGANMPMANLLGVKV